MNYENEEFNVYILEKAVDKLIHYGLQIFEMYANESGMSFCDRNRVIAKCRYLTKDDKYLELECPDNLKSERWNYYTKTLGYSQDRARKILKIIDEVYKKPPIVPINSLNRLASGAVKGV